MMQFQWSNRFGVLVLFLAAMMANQGLAQAQTDSNMEILKEKLKADKKLLMAANLGLTEEEASVFWPIYDEYQKELEGLNQRVVDVISSYANEYNASTLTDEKARELMTEALSIDEAEVALKKKYFERLNGVVPAMKAVRFIQMENKIRALADYELAAQIPLVE